MTFPEFLNTMTYSDNLASEFPGDAPKRPGLIYAGFFWVAQWEPGLFWVSVPNGQCFNESLRYCERWLWENYAKAEMEAVTP